MEADEFPRAKTAVTIFKHDTVYNADSVEWCPHKPNTSFFVCGNYQLTAEKGAQDLRPSETRLGRILLFSIDFFQGLELHQTIETAAVLDQKWCPNQIDGASILGVVNANHSLEIYKLLNRNLELVTKFFVIDDNSETLILSLDWSSGKFDSQQPQIICSDSNGNIHLLQLANNELIFQKTLHAHDFQAWICGFNYWDASVFFSGGDDSVFLKFDLRCGDLPVAKNKLHEAGVTSLHSNKSREFLVVSGRIIFIKMANGKPNLKANTLLRTQMLSKSSQFEEISPIANNEVENAFKKAHGKSTASTPSPLTKRKRKLERSSLDKPPAAKKLYSGSPIPNEPLDIEQKDVLDACLSGQNVFFTGSAGTGKSYLIKRIIGALPPDVTVTTASTGVAACQIGGITLHQFAGIGGGDATIERSIELASKPSTITMWRKCKHLIIDEISMVDGSYFEKIEEVSRKVRKNDKPFGGIQLILCGDFLQLPPVTRPVPGEKTAAPPKFCFQTKAWRNCMLNTFELKRVHRQTDNKFITILNKIRIGKVDEDVVNALAATSKQKIEIDGILATRLCSHTKDADIINVSKLQALTGEAKVFESEDSVIGTSKMLDNQTPVPGRLELKVGAQVMLLKNINVSAGLVNGARGVIKEFRNGLPLVQFRNRKEYLAQREQWIIKTAGGASLGRKQVPLKLAWAFSIHKSQGLTLDCVEMSLGRVFEAGQAYVALSRSQSLESLRVLDFKANQVWANPEVLTFYRTLDQTRIIPLGGGNVLNRKLKKSNLVKSKLLMGKPIVTIS